MSEPYNTNKVRLLASEGYQTAGLVYGTLIITPEKMFANPGETSVKFIARSTSDNSAMIGNQSLLIFISKDFKTPVQYGNAQTVTVQYITSTTDPTYKISIDVPNDGTKVVQVYGIRFQQ